MTVFTAGELVHLLGIKSLRYLFSSSFILANNQKIDSYLLLEIYVRFESIPVT